MNGLHSTPPSLHLITGYLGSGKTTFLRRLLEKNILNEPTAVIVNDFGDVVYDGLLLRESRQEDHRLNADSPAPFVVFDVPGGCLCCSVVDDFRLALNDIIARGYSRVFIEATGLANAEQVRADVAFLGFPVDSTLCVVDALNYPQMHGIFSTIDEQVAAADVLLLSKTDIAERASLSATHEALRRTNTRAAVVYLKNGAVPTDFLVTTFAAAEHFASTQIAQEHLLRDGIAAFRVQLHEVITEDALLAALDQLPANVLRVKGVVRIAAEHLAESHTKSKLEYPTEAASTHVLINYVCGRTEITNVSEQESEMQPEIQPNAPIASLFVIGRNLDAALIQTCFQDIASRIESGTVRSGGLRKNAADYHP